MSNVTDTLSNLLHQTAFFNLTWGNYLMILVAFVFLFLAIKKGFEPLLPVSYTHLLRESGAFAADVSSAVETGGYKDREKVEAFIRAVREQQTDTCRHYSFARSAQ